MRMRCLVCFLLATFAGAQTAKPPAPETKSEIIAKAHDKSPEIEVGPDDPVITINGFCADPAQPHDACRTVVTRSQFEKLTAALQPGMSPSLRLSVANAYARNLRMSAVAEKRGLDKAPAFAEEMRFARMQLLAQDLNRVLQAEANDISDADLEEYYTRNESTYEQATVARIFVPHAKQPISATPAAAPQQEAAAEEMAKIAADLRLRAVHGEDPDQLQLEAYAQAGEPRTTVNTKMEKVRRSTLPPQHEKVMELKPGEVSEVFSDPAGAHFIYKMISKQTLPLEEVKSEIRSAISAQRLRESTKPFQGDVAFNDAYFIPAGKLDTASPRNRSPRKKKPLQTGESRD